MNKWDKYFLDVCNTVAGNSKCLSRKIGAIIIRDKSIISTGYNGPPRGVPSCTRRYHYDGDNLIDKSFYMACLGKEKFVYDDHCPRQTLGFKSGEGLEWCVAGHAERNSIVNAAREGVSVKGAIMYMNCPVPCTPGLVEIITAGISEIVVTEMIYYDKMSEYLIKNSQLLVRQYDL